MPLPSNSLPRSTARHGGRCAPFCGYRRNPGRQSVAQPSCGVVHGSVEAVKLPANLEGETVARLGAKAAVLRADTRWAPTETDVQRAAPCCWRFNQPHNLPPAEDRRAGDKSRQQIYKDILARRLLALDAGAARPEAACYGSSTRGQKVDPNRASGGRGHRSLDDLPRADRTARRPRRSLAGGGGDAWHDRRRSRRRVQRAGRPQVH